MDPVYLDVCTLCRPFDDQRSARIRNETMAYFRIIEAVQKGRFALMVSPVHIEEINAISDAAEKDELLALLDKLGTKIEFDPFSVRSHLDLLRSYGLAVPDALHAAFASGYANVFVTCDDRLIKKCRKINLGIEVLTPLEFALRERL